MKIRVKLYGTVTKHFPNYEPEHGIVVEIPKGSSVADLITHLGISKTKVGIITVEERVIRSDDELRDDASVNIYQLISGG